MCDRNPAKTPHHRNIHIIVKFNVGIKWFPVQFISKYLYIETLECPCRFLFNHRQTQYNGDIYEMLISIFDCLLNRSINIIKDASPYWKKKIGFSDHETINHIIRMRQMWSTENCAKWRNLTMQTSDIYTNLNSSWRRRCIKFSWIWKYKQIT